MSLSPWKNKSKKVLLAQRNLLKDIINAFTRYYYAEIPDVEPQTKTSKLTQEIFQMLQENLKHQTPKVQKAYKDENFPRLLEMVKKLIIFMSETDNHYEKWIGYFYIHCMLKMNRLYEAWEQNQLPPLKPEFKEFTEWFLNNSSCTT